MKPGAKTTEFYLSLAVDISATILLLTKHIDQATWAATTGGMSGVYALARTYLKGKP